MRNLILHKIKLHIGAIYLCVIIPLISLSLISIAYAQQHANNTHSTLDGTMLDSKKTLNDILTVTQDLHKELHSMGCVVTNLNTTPNEVSDWAFAEGRSVYTPRFSVYPGEFPVSFYWDGKKNYTIQRGKWRGKDLDYAMTMPGTKEYSQWTPIEFAYLLNRGVWLDKALSNPHADLIGVSKDARLGTLYRVRTFLNILGGETCTMTLAKAYNYAVIKSEIYVNGEPNTHECSDFTKVNGYWVPQSATFMRTGLVMRFKFSDIRVNTVRNDETKWKYPVGSKMYDEKTNTKYTLTSSGEWIGQNVPQPQLSKPLSDRTPRSLYSCLFAAGMGSLFITWFIRRRYFS